MINYITFATTIIIELGAAAFLISFTREYQKWKELHQFISEAIIVIIAAQW